MGEGEWGGEGGGAEGWRWRKGRKERRRGGVRKGGIGKEWRREGSGEREEGETEVGRRRGKEE